jgi:hypothetical protein
MKAMEPVAQEMYASAQGASAQQAGPQGGAADAQAQEPKKDSAADDVVDADFTMK